MTVGSLVDVKQESIVLRHSGKEWHTDCFSSTWVCFGNFVTLRKLLWIISVAQAPVRVSLSSYLLWLPASLILLFLISFNTSLPWGWHSMKQRPRLMYCTEVAIHRKHNHLYLMSNTEVIQPTTLQIFQSVSCMYLKKFESVCKMYQGVNDNNKKPPTEYTIYILYIYMSFLSSCHRVVCWSCDTLFCCVLFKATPKVCASYLAVRLLIFILEGCSDMRSRLCVRSDFEIIKVVMGKDASEAHSIIIIRSSNPQMTLGASSIRRIFTLMHSSLFLLPVPSAIYSPLNQSHFATISVVSVKL